VARCPQIALCAPVCRCGVQRWAHEQTQAIVAVQEPATADRPHAHEDRVAALRCRGNRRRLAAPKDRHSRLRLLLRQAVICEIARQIQEDLDEVLPA
jgi:hypothetical protein